MLEELFPPASVAALISIMHTPVDGLHEFISPLLVATSSCLVTGSKVSTGVISREDKVVVCRRLLLRPAVAGEVGVVWSG